MRPICQMKKCPEIVVARLEWLDRRRDFCMFHTLFHLWLSDFKAQITESTFPREKLLDEAKKFAEERRQEWNGALTGRSSPKESSQA